MERYAPGVVLSLARLCLASCFVALAACTSGGKLAAADASAPVGEGRVDAGVERRHAAASRRQLGEPARRLPPPPMPPSIPACPLGRSTPRRRLPLPSPSTHASGPPTTMRRCRRGPGLVLDGGTLVTAGITWARSTLGADPSRPRFRRGHRLGDGGRPIFLLLRRGPLRLGANGADRAGRQRRRPCPRCRHRRPRRVRVSSLAASSPPTRGGTGRRSRGRCKASTTAAESSRGRARGRSSSARSSSMRSLPAASARP